MKRIEVWLKGWGWCGPTMIADGNVSAIMMVLGLNIPPSPIILESRMGNGRFWFTARGWMKKGKPLLDALEEKYPDLEFRVLTENNGSVVWQDDDQLFIRMD